MSRFESLFYHIDAKREVNVGFTSPEVARFRPQVANALQASQVLQRRLLDLHILISTEDSRNKEARDEVLASVWASWMNRNSIRRYDEIRESLKAIDYQRQQALGRIDGTVRSLRSFQADIAVLEELPQHTSRHYQLLQLGHSVQKLGRSKGGGEEMCLLLDQIVELSVTREQMTHRRVIESA